MAEHDEPTETENQRQRKERVADAWQTVLATYKGRTVIAEILAELRGNGRAFAADPMRTAYALGRLEAGVGLAEKVYRISQDNYNQMEKENP